jgi:medium-chain acyl-[acyl-carrier-protein] hydrolase
LRRNYQLIPRHLFVSGRRAPQIPYREPRTFDLPDEEFLQDLFSSSGSQRDRLDPQITKLLLPMMRADFEVVQTHVYSPEPPLSCPITVFGGSYDNVVTREQLDAWQHQTMSRCTVRILPGDHFFIKTSQAELLQSISQELQ